MNIRFPLRSYSMASSLQVWHAVLSRFTNLLELVVYLKYYNEDRIKLRHGGMSPVQYRIANQVMIN